MKTLRERFDAKWIPEPFSGCWLWTHSINWAGYGKIGMGKTWTPAPRIAWQLYRGSIPEKMCVLHHCDTRSCVNPDHLFLGTKGDNNRDCSQKNRRNAPRGEAHSQSKLTLSQAEEIRHSTGTQRAIAKKFRIGPTQVWEIRNNKAWKTT